MSLEKLIRNFLGFPEHSQVSPQWDDCCFYRADISFYVESIHEEIRMRACRSGEYLLIDPNVIPNDCSCPRVSYLNIDNKIKSLHSTDRLHCVKSATFTPFLVQPVTNHCF